MSKMSELDLTVKELRNAAQALTAAADGLVALFAACDEQPAATVSKTEKVAPEPKPLTLEQVRAVLADKSRAGFTAQIRELLLKHGAEKLSAIDPAEYPVLLVEAEGLGNG